MEEFEEIEIEFSEEEYAQVVEAANEKGMTVDEFVVYALEEYLKKVEANEL